ncbi:MAG: DEAD/DEAH box helicase [Candidatus Odinarchaeota archaeon]|nr:DEAD/DEAH box helicase [Candidatus Odinarchaeota archaeon]
MPSKLKCPFCDGEIKFEILEKGKWRIYCNKCGKEAFTPKFFTGDYMDAYHYFLSVYREEIDKQKIEKAPYANIDWRKLPDVLKAILMDKVYTLVYYKSYDEQEGVFSKPIDELDLHPAIKKYLKASGIERLFSFQERAIKTILRGENTVIVAPTGNGKTEAFLIPIAQKILTGKPDWGALAYPTSSVKALFIYPTKALARDQLDKFKKLERFSGIRFEIFDGDTPSYKRKEILSNPPDILITNPDMIHVHLMKRNPFKKIISGVRFVVLDEIHQYKGAFGSNVYFILRRLERIAGDFQIIGASATIANPKEFGEQLFGRSVTVVECERGRRGRIHFLMLYPQTISANLMIGRVAKLLTQHGYKVLIFANSHKTAELINLILRRLSVISYVHRAGLPERMRHRIEDAFKRGEIKALVATPTLELGVDIGDLDAVVSVIIGITRLIQRIGRAGRRGQESIAILALRNDDPISTYYLEKPEDYFKNIDPAFVDPSNEVVAYHQILAASIDSPLKKDEFQNFKDIINNLIAENLLIVRRNRLHPSYTKAKKILAKYNLRGVGDIVKITDGKRILGFRNMPMAARELHPGAVYIHAGTLYKSIDFKFNGKEGYALVEKLPPDYPYKTDALRASFPEILEIKERKTVFGTEVIYGKLRITEEVYGYVVTETFTEKKVETKILDEPIRYTFDTMGFVFTAPSPTKTVDEYAKKPDLPEGLLSEEDLLAGAFHAVEHVLIEGSPMLTGGGSSEIGGISLGTSGMIVIYDGTPGGSGLSKLLFNRLDMAIKNSLSILKSCKCKRIDGCPACTYSYQCGNNNRPLFKVGAIEALEKLLKEKEKISVRHELFTLFKPIV